jgi:hypothetical protein
MVLSGAHYGGIEDGLVVSECFANQLFLLLLHVKIQIYQRLLSRVQCAPLSLSLRIRILLHFTEPKKSSCKQQQHI